MLTTLKSGYYLGVDGGATKTEAAISDESGYVLGTGIAGGSNLHNLDPQEALANICMAVDKAREAVYRKNHNVIPEHIRFEAVCFGLAGLDSQEDKQLMINVINEYMRTTKRMFMCKKMLLVNDGVIALKASTDNNWGICLIAGTGSNCYGLSLSGKEAFAGDWGYILGDQGSGFCLGQAILRQIMREYDGRVPRSKLTDVVLKYLHLSDPQELVSWVYKGGKVPIDKIASITHCFEEEMVLDSVELMQMINGTIKELMDAYITVTKRLNFDSDDKFVVALNGGLFKMKGRFCERITQSIQTRHPNAHIIVAQHSATRGAIKLALMLNSRFNVFPDSATIIHNPVEKD